MWSLKAICGHVHCGPRRCLLSLQSVPGGVCGPCSWAHRTRCTADGKQRTKCLTSSDASVQHEAVPRPFVANPSTDLPKNFDPQASEEQIYQWWDSNGFFLPNMETAGEPFVISMPPPNVTGRLHMGHAMFVTLQDIMIRFARMRGRCTLWVPGTDHAGIATQMVVEKMLSAEGTSRQELGREKFTERVWEWNAEYGGTITKQLRCLGASCDWSREAFTLSSELSDAVNEAFVRLHEKGLIYRGSYMVNWSPSLQTAVSDLEVEYSEEEGMLYYFK